MSEPGLDAPERCVQCGGGGMTRLPMVLTDGTEVLFVSCHSCEQRQWLTEEEGGWTALPIESVLARTQKPTR
ncbi:hypothetical protein [Actinotalea sp.]|uniref:hypothetical protein n=1 Tax=Actinotalea sp. TaxID=1872145 RepID=UPI003562C524